MPPRKNPDASANVPSFYGAELRYQRELAGLTLEQLAEGSFRGVPFLSQIERGERRMPLDLARHVDKVLKTDGFFERRCEDARRARQSGHAEYFADVAEMERHAETIEDWAPMLVPGLLQTQAYAEAVVHTSLPWLPPETVDKQVRARLQRAEIWEREERPSFWAVLHESLVRKPLLPPTQMSEQLEHIAHVIRSTQGVLQILPETTHAHPFMMGMMRVMTFPDAPAVAYTEGLHNGQLIDYPALVKNYRRSYDLLRAAALPPEASLAMVEQAAEDYRDGKHRD
ncbi:helix-turn-helix domain-containing protein [Streptomyces sp. NPDC059680]|uniref:helix-turn-helix domain-containing protein n=1 Tax=Streptomyces TaxID=1883 RepID=UPI001E29EC8D|nr:helix-turn-helix transcriptional regulator [Streptomyces barringtoniae]MCC5478696.1 helix-turn-helix transcriptional regulator [Streptomyces barringtoniae]